MRHTLKPACAIPYDPDFMVETPRAKWAGILGLCGIGLALSLWGGTPFQQLDSIVLRARHVLANGGNPEFFHYPALVIYLAAIPYGLLHAILGDVAANDLFRESSRSFETPFFSYFFLGHLMSASFGILGVLSVRSAAKTLFGCSNIALGCGLLLATSLLWITDTHMVTVDVPLAALLALTAERTITVVSRERAATFLEVTIIGLCAGLATSAKYNGAIILAPVTASLVWHAFKTNGQRLRALLWPGGVALGVFALTNPFVFLEFDLFQEDLRFEWRHSRLGHAGYLTDNGFVFHIMNSLLPGYGGFALVLALVGAGFAAHCRSITAAAKVMFLGFPLLHFLLIGNSQLAFQRYMLPMLPFLALMTGGLLMWFKSRSRSWHMAGLLLVGIAAARGAYWGVKHDMLLDKPDIRRELVLALEKADLDLGGVPVYGQGDVARCARWAKLPFQKNLRLRSPIVTKNPSRLFLFDSFLQDRVLYDDPPPHKHMFYPGNENVVPFEGFEDFVIVQLSPYTVPKDQVPVSRKSPYSPSLPDLRYRTKAGPFFELCFRDAAEADKLVAACEELGIDCQRLNGSEAWYFQRLRELARKRIERL